MSDSQEIAISELQNEILRIPENVNLFLGGGRGGGKTEVIPYLTFRHCMQYAENAKVLIVRQQWRDLEQLKDLFVKVFSTLLQEPNIKKHWNKAESKWSLPNGATVQFTQCESREDYQRHHGKSYSMLVFEELPSWPTPVIFDLLRSTLRQPKATRRIICTGNPGGPGHAFCYENFANPCLTPQFKIPL